MYNIRGRLAEDAEVAVARVDARAADRQEVAAYDLDLRRHRDRGPVRRGVVHRQGRQHMEAQTLAVAVRRQRARGDVGVLESEQIRGVYMVVSK